MPASAVSRPPAAARGSARPKLLVVGGCDVHLRIDLMRALSDGYETAAAGTDESSRRFFAEAGFDYHLYPLSRGVDPLRDLVSMHRLHALFRRLRPDVVHAFATKPCVWARIAARHAGVPVVVGTIPGLGSLYTSSSPRARAARMIYERLQRLASTRSDMTIFQNRQDLEQFRAARLVSETRSTLVAGSGVRTDYFDPSRVTAGARDRTRRDLEVAPGALVVTMITRVIRTKGVLEFAAAAEAVRVIFPRVEFLLVGPDDRDSIDRLTQAESERLGRAVHRVGPRSDIRSVLAASDVFVLPSYYREGVPRSLLEAASMALPLVAARGPGSSDVVRDGVNGFLVPPRDPDPLTEAIGTLLVDPDLRARFGAESRRLAREMFDLSVIAGQISAVYAACSATRSVV